MYVDLKTLISQVVAGGNQANGARCIYPAKRVQVEADSADGHSTKVCLALVKQLSAPAAELADQADSHAARVACALVSDQEAAA